MRHLHGSHINKNKIDDGGDKKSSPPSNQKYFHLGVLFISLYRPSTVIQCLAILVYHHQGSWAVAIVNRTLGLKVDSLCVELYRFIILSTLVEFVSPLFKVLSRCSVDKTIATTWERCLAMSVWNYTLFWGGLNVLRVDVWCARVTFHRLVCLSLLHAVCFAPFLWWDSAWLGYAEESSGSFF